MTDPCAHARTGVVTSHQQHVGLFEARTLGPHATTPVCNRPECIAEALKWVTRMTRQTAFYVPDSDRGVR